MTQYLIEEAVFGLLDHVERRERAAERAASLQVEDLIGGGGVAATDPVAAATAQARAWAMGAGD